MGFDLDRPPFLPPIKGAVEAARSRLRLPGRVLLNELSHPDFGWSLRDRFDGWELNGKAATVLGGFRMLRGFAADGMVICTDRNFVKFCDYGSTETINFGLLKVRPGAVDAAVRELRTILPDDVQALSRPAIRAREEDHWVNQTSTGKLFAFGVLVAMVVATVVVYKATQELAGIPMRMTLENLGITLVLAVVVGVGTGLSTIGKLRRADPAELF
jgi:putative ABC transport system permease protein